MDKKLCLSENKIIGGVCGGIAEYFDFEPSLVRIVWVLMFFLISVFMIVLYFVCWAILPSKK
ncbi:PspC family transcriptional regulator [Tyzzerella sp. An114]|uniref:PspC domain-containing protein n=1 Tax=Tyzzerella sp. An114 TaxID=1965545 RepID=UPI000B43CAE7|nr:PspC domain-containing protein [Tyzzerella sp. An114]OUQ58823.1 PspC family transcriptional regulator [Tyzzerella sp. An114]